MQYLFIIMGKSGSGKDTIVKVLSEDKELGLHKIVPFTTRPPREGEVNGIDYNFITKDVYMSLVRDGAILESREYNHVSGKVYYGTYRNVCSKENCIMVNTIEGYKSISRYYKHSTDIVVVPLYIKVSNFDRLLRSISRESNNKSDKAIYEFCRRLVSDEEEFSDDVINSLLYEEQIFENQDLNLTVLRLKDYIRKVMEKC